jgi:hypothetical protein
LCERNLLQDTERMDVNEKLVIFLHTIGHNLRNRVLQDKFQHSGETISRHFNKVLKAINGLRDVCIKDPPDAVPSKILGDSRYYPYFKVYFTLKHKFIFHMTCNSCNPYFAVINFCFGIELSRSN